MTSSAPRPRRLALDGSQLDLTLDRLAVPVLGLVAVASAAFIYHQTRGSSFSTDDFAWISARRGDSAGAFLAPYNGHLSLVPIAIYRAMFALEGIASFAPYRVLLAVVATLAGLVFFEYAHHRVGAFGALLLTTLLLFLGPGWNDIMQPFQIAWLIAVAGGVLALSLLDRRRLPTDLLACLALLIAVATTSVGVALLVGAAFDVALHRRRWRDAWIAGVPLVLYVAWAVHYHPSTIKLSALTTAPLNLVQTTGAAVAGVLGLSAVTPSDLTGVMLTFGVSLLALTAVVAIVRIPAGWDSIRFVSLAVALVVFSLLTTLVRSFQSPFESRYMYVTCVLVALLAVELVRGLHVAPRIQMALAVLTLIAVVSDLSDLRSGGAEFRRLGAQTDATLGALTLDRDRVAPGQALTQLPLNGVGFDLTAGDYFTAERALGTPAYTVAQLQHASPAAQRFADAQLLADGDVQLAAATASPSPSGAPVGVVGVSGGTIARQGLCVRFTPAATLAPGASSSLTLRLGPGRVRVSARSAAVTLAARRFSPAPVAFGTVAPGGAGVVTVAADRSPLPWFLQFQSTAPVRVCTVGGG
jgi:hypothetical protein